MNIRFKKEDIAIVVIAIIVVLLYIAILVHFISTTKIAITKKQANLNNTEAQQENNGVEQEATTTKWKCLGEYEEAGFYNGCGKFAQKGMPKEYPLKVIIREKENKVVKNKIIINDIAEDQDAVEIYKCGIYVIREFNFDEKNFKSKKGYKSELYKYDYSSNLERILIFSEKPDEFISYYNSGFRIPKTEHYIALIKGYYGKNDYSLVIKDLNTREDIFVLSHNKLMKQYPEIKGMFDFREWTKDGRYFYGALSDAAIERGFFRIDTEIWEYEVFEVPEFIGGGDQLNVETGWVTYHTDMVWTGFYDITEAIKQERREQGIGTTLYIYNLLTKEKRFIYKTEEPLWFTKPEWLSDMELEYELPNGEKRIYKLK
ncbi:hypothetical protein KAU19_03255 [Candidatus Parcubacteria bacterium]|nr:hypothetical protein [Candidatus Parcubacteria bacterium]